MGEHVPVHDGLFVLDDGAPGGGRLVGGYSPTSGRHHFPLLGTCPYSGAADVERVELSTEGTLWGWTAVTAAPPGYRGAVPYGFGVVELPAERLRVITRLTEPDPSRLRFGQPMRLRVVPLHTADDGSTVVTYAFAPEDE
jgi:uncharacterized protein